MVGVTYIDSGDQEEADFLPGAQATASYINKNAGGIDGRPVELAVCKLDGSPESSVRCAHELTGKHVTAVVAGHDVGTDASLPIYKKAGIPYISYSARTSQMYVNPVAVALGGGVPGYGAIFAKFLVQNQGAKKIAMVTPDVVPVPAIRQYFAQPVKKLGGQMKIVSYSTSSPDVTAPLQAAAQSKPDAMIVVLETENACVQGMRAQQQLAIKVKTLQLECTADSIVKAAGSAADGMFFAAGSDVGSGATSADLRTYLAFMKQYAPRVDASGDARWAAMALMTLRDAVKGKPADLTPAGVLKAFRAPQGGHVFLGADYRCGESKSLPSVCFNQLRFARYADGAKRSASGWVSAPELL